jgi:hypothetical protein
MRHYKRRPLHPSRLRAISPHGFDQEMRRTWQAVGISRFQRVGGDTRGAACAHPRTLLSSRHFPRLKRSRSPWSWQDFTQTTQAFAEIGSARCGAADAAMRGMHRTMSRSSGLRMCQPRRPNFPGTAPCKEHREAKRRRFGQRARDPGMDARAWRPKQGSSRGLLPRKTRAPRTGECAQGCAGSSRPSPSSTGPMGSARR